MPSDEQLSFAVESLLYSRPLEFRTLGPLLDEVLRTVREVRVKLVISEVALGPLLAEAPESQRARFTPAFVTDDAVAGHLTGRFGRRPTEVVEGRLAALRHPTAPLVWLVITDAKTEFLARPFRYLMRSSSPRPTAPILRTPQIQSLVEGLQERIHTAIPDGPSTAVRVSQIGYRGRIASVGAHKAVERDRKWTDINVEEAFSDAINAGQWVTDVGVEYPDPKHSSQRARARVGRYGVFAFRRSATPAFDALITPAALIAQQWYQFLRDRARRKANQFTTRPFRIEFGYPVLSTTEQVSLLRRALRHIPSVTCTVLHGNPYFHAVMLDYRDGSTYEVLVADEQGISVIPQGRSTVGALQRLCSRVFADFREGDLVESRGNGLQGIAGG